MTRVPFDPSEVAQVRESGWSGTHHVDPATGQRITGVGFGLDESWHNPREVIAWRDLEAIAEAIPTEVRQRLVALRDRMLEHRRVYPRFAASAAAVGCGPIVEGQPLSPRPRSSHQLSMLDAADVWRAEPDVAKSRPALLPPAPQPRSIAEYHLAPASTQTGIAR